MKKGGDFVRKRGGGKRGGSFLDSAPEGRAHLGDRREEEGVKGFDLVSFSPGAGVGEGKKKKKYSVLPRLRVTNGQKKKG